jgi:hypothetical protein
MENVRHEGLHSRRSGPVMRGQNRTNHVFVDLQAKVLSQVQGDLQTTKAGNAPLKVADGLDSVQAQALGARA